MSKGGSTACLLASIDTGVSPKRVTTPTGEAQAHQILFTHEELKSLLVRLRYEGAREVLQANRAAPQKYIELKKLYEDRTTRELGPWKHHLCYVLDYGIGETPNARYKTAVGVVNGWDAPEETRGQLRQWLKRTYDGLCQATSSTELECN